MQRDYVSKPSESSLPEIAKETPAFSLVEQLSKAVREIQAEAHTADARAAVLIKEAADKLSAAENRIRSMAADRQAKEKHISEAMIRAQQAEFALDEAHARLQATEAEFRAAEDRMEAAEVRADLTQQQLDLLEEAIRTVLSDLSSKKTAKRKAA